MKTYEEHWQIFTGGKGLIFQGLLLDQLTTGYEGYLTLETLENIR